MTKSKDEKIKIGKNQLRLIGAEMLLKIAAVTNLQTLRFEAFDNIFEVAKDAYQRYRGSNYIIEQIKKSGIIPRGLLREGNQFSYVGANERIITVTDPNDFILDLCDVGLEYGFSPEWMMIFFRDLYYYEILVDGITHEFLDEIRKEAYNNNSKFYTSKR